MAGGVAKQGSSLAVEALAQVRGACAGRWRVSGAGSTRSHAHAPCAPCLLPPLQASANTLLAHLVSVVFLTFMIRKITAAYQRVLEWGENLAKSMPKL